MILVIAIGNVFRRDDGAGPAVAEKLRGQDGLEIIQLPGEGTELIEAWDGRDKVLVVDAMRSGRAAGEIRRFDGLRDDLPPDDFASLSHRFGLAQAVEMGRILGRLPKSLTIFGIEAVEFGQGLGLTSEVAAGADRLASEIIGLTTGQ